MNFVQSVGTCFRKYVGFRGVASRPEYWYFYLFGFIGNVIAGATKIHLLEVLWVLALLLPSTAVAVRRFRDGGNSPWWAAATVSLQLTSLILGRNGSRHVNNAHSASAGSGVAILVLLLLAIVSIVLLCQKTKYVGNKYYPDRVDPLAISSIDSSGDSSSYCSHCGKLRLPGQSSCTGCGEGF